MRIQKQKKIFPMFLWAGFRMTLLLPLLFCLLLPNPVSASNVASGLTISTATSGTHQRKSFYANGRYWVFYSDATNMVFKTSADGISWGSATTVRAADSGSRFSVFFDGTYFHYAYSAETANTPIYYRRGQPNSDGTVTWSAVEQTALAAVSTDTYNGPNITVATDGRAWIGYEYYTSTGPDRYPCVTRNLNTDGTWSTDTGNSFPYQLSGRIGGTGNIQVVQPVPLTSGYVFCLYTATGFTIRGKRWNGSWDVTATQTQNAVLGSNAYSAVNEGNDVHLCFVTGSNPDTLLYNKYTYDTGFSATDTSVQGSPTGGLPAVSLDTTTNTLYCFWRCYNNNTHIYYKRKNSAGTWDSSYTDWIDESTDGLTAADRLTAFYRDYGGKIGLVYMAQTSSPNYKVNFAQILEGMKQVIIGGYNDNLSNSAPEYNTIAGGYTWTTTADQRKQVVSTAGTLKNLFVELSAGPGSGTSYTFTVMKNGAATSLAVPISNTATTGSDPANSIAVVAGDTIQLRSTYTGTPGTPTARWSVMFEGSYARESLILGAGASNNGQVVYLPA